MTTRAERKLAASIAIRELIKCAIDGNRIFNNIYKTGTRTIKVYKVTLERADVDVRDLRERIECLADLFDFDVKFRETACSTFRSGAFIVKI